MTDWVGYGLEVAAVVIVIGAILVSWLWRRADRSLLSETKVLVEALGPAVQGIEGQVQKLRADQRSTADQVSAIQRASGSGTSRATVKAVAGPPTAPQAVVGRELRRQQAQVLKEQKFRWQQTKDLAKAIRWVLERLDEDD